VEPEPVVPTNPLLTAPNVVLTPHVGSRPHPGSVLRWRLRSRRALSCRLARHGRPPERPQQGVAQCSATLAGAGHTSQDGGG